METRNTSSSTEYRTVPRTRNLTFFVGNSEQVGAALQMEMLLEHLIAPENARTIFVERSLSYEAMVQIVHDRTNSPSDVIVFEEIDDINTVVLILVLIERGISVWAGVEAMGPQAAMKHIQSLLIEQEPGDESESSLSEIQQTIQSGWNCLIRSEHLFEIVDLDALERKTLIAAEQEASIEVTPL